MKKTLNKKVLILTALITVITVIMPFFAVKNTFADVEEIGNSYYLNAQRLYSATSNENQFDISAFDKENVVKEANDINFTSGNGTLTGRTLESSKLTFNYNYNYTRNGIFGFNVKLKEAFPSAIIGNTYNLYVQEENVGTKRIYLYQANIIWNFNETITITQAMLDSDIYVYTKNENFRTGVNEYTTSYIKGISIVLSNSTYTEWQPSPTTFYNIGYNSGYVDGTTNGENIGYDDGYNNGYNVGYSNGYQDASNGEELKETETIFDFYKNIRSTTGGIVETNEEAQTITFRGTQSTITILYNRQTTLYNSKFVARVQYQLPPDDKTTATVSYTYNIGYATIDGYGNIAEKIQLWNNNEGVWKEINFPALNTNQTIYLEMNLRNQTITTQPPFVTYTALRLVRSGTLDTIYNAGYGQGYQDGEQNGYKDGVETAQENSYNQGYNAGVIAGVANTNKYTFLGLISAVVDAPIKALTSFFNFDLLGFNMAGLIQALFTLFVILTILRLILG